MEFLDQAEKQLILQKSILELNRGNGVSSPDELRTMILKDLTLFNAMTTEEYILWQKWEEVNLQYPMQQSGLFIDEHAHVHASDAQNIKLVRSLLYDDPTYTNIAPELLWIGDPRYSHIRDHWTLLRIMIHTQQHSGSIGRGLNYLVRDKTTQKYLGLISIASDFLDLTARDKVIGWTRHQRTQEQRIQHTAVCSTIVPVQPFGYNFVGGKLLALLCLSQDIQKLWQNLYGSVLVGLTTTSLYGKDKGGHGMSQYDNLAYWKKMGYSTGSTSFRVSQVVKNAAFEWAKINLPAEYEKYQGEGSYAVRDKLNRFFNAIYRALKIPAANFISNHDRGIYFAPLYHNTNEFLRNEIPEQDLKSIAPFTVEELTLLWKNKYASKRFTSLTNTDRLKTEPLFYEDLAIMTWDEAKTKYLPAVGR